MVSWQRLVWLCVTACAAVSLARLPSDLPGQEITEEQYLDFMYPRDSVAAAVPLGTPHSPTWLDTAMKSWDAPPLSKQLAEDRKNVKMGMGAVFIPRMSDEAALEPDVEILDTTGEELARTKPGEKTSLVPGTYYVMVGSGTHQQKMVKKITVEESETTPIVPTWSGLSIEVVDENNQPFRGEYELARIDEFEPYGRGFGRDPNLAEEVRTWILKPGLYKIFGVGESYNTLTNFVTVRLFPGEFIRFLLVENSPTAMRIIGGGNITDEYAQGPTSHWRYNVNIGGGLDFSATVDHQDDSTSSISSLSLLFNSGFNYRKNPVEWETQLRLNQNVTFRGFDITRLTSNDDEARLSSIYTWRFLPWLGPYGRLELSTELFPEYVRIPEGVEPANHYFVFTDEDSVIEDYSSSITSYPLEPVFSPFAFEAGIGANTNVLSTKYIDARLLSGFGFKQETRWNEAEIIDELDSIVFDSSAFAASLHDSLRQFIDTSAVTVIKDIDATTTRPEYGPEGAIYSSLRLGRFASIDAEVKLFWPIARMISGGEALRPDFRFWTTTSWRLTRQVTLEYQYVFEHRWPLEEAAREVESDHRILLRFSIASR
jgi:hypothetical protein